MAGRKRIQTADYKGWKQLEKMQEVKLPNEEECKLKCCHGIGRRVSIKLGKNESSRREGTVTHFNTIRIIVELDHKAGEVRIDKAMMTNVTFFKDDEADRKMRNEKIKSKMDLNVPSVFLEKEIVSDGLD